MSDQRPDPRIGTPGSVFEERRAAPGSRPPRFEAPRGDSFRIAGSRPPLGGPGAGSGVGASATGPFGAVKGPPSGPPARVGSAVAALVAAILTLILPAFFWVLGMPLLALLVNIPGIAFGAIALSKTANPPEVERFLRYSWACTIIYIALVVIIVAGLVLFISMSLSPP